MVKLQPTPEQSIALLETMERFNAACNAVAEIAFRERTANKFRLQKIVYYNIREQYGLSAQMAVRAISKVCEVYKRDRSKKPSFRPRGAIPYDQRVLSWKGLDQVSILTLQGLTTVDDFIIIYFSQDRLDPNQKARVFTCAFDNSSR